MTRKTHTRSGRENETEQQVQGVLALLDPLPAVPRPPPLASRHARDDEAHPREQLSPVTPPWPPPAERGQLPARYIRRIPLRRPPHRPPEQSPVAAPRCLIAGSSRWSGLAKTKETLEVQYITPPVRTAASALAVTELVEGEVLPVSVVRRSLLFSMDSPNCPCQDHPPVRAGHSSVHPLSVHSAQPFHVAVLGKHLGLEPAHGVGAGGRSFRPLAVQRLPAVLLGARRGLQRYDRPGSLGRPANSRQASQTRETGGVERTSATSLALMITTVRYSASRRLRQALQGGEMWA